MSLQAHLSRLGFSPGRLDGVRGPKTQAALEAAGRRYSWPELSSMPSEQAERDLAEVIRTERGKIPILTAGQLSEFAPLILPAWIGPLNAFLVDAHITEERLPSMLGQLAHESSGLRLAEEIQGSRQRYAPYYGRGPIQLTLRENYQRAGDYLGIDLVASPELVALPAIGWGCAGWWCLDNGLNEIIDGGDFLALTRRINGGTNGAADRVRWRDKARSLFWRGAPAAPRQRTAPLRATASLRATAPPAEAEDQQEEILDAPPPLPPPPPMPAPLPAPLPLSSPPASGLKMAKDKVRRKTIRKLFRKNKDFWIGQYADYRAQGLDHDEALEEVGEDFTDYALTSLAQRLDKRARWRFVSNPKIRAQLEEWDGGVFLAVLRGALKVVELAKAPLSGLLEDSGAKGILADFFESFSGLVEEVVEPDEERPTVVDRRADDIPTLTASSVEAPSAARAKSRLLGLRDAP